jgi:hypothetical protein
MTRCQPSCSLSDFSTLRNTMKRGATSKSKLPTGQDLHFELAKFTVRLPYAENREQGIVCLDAHPGQGQGSVYHLVDCLNNG